MNGDAGLGQVRDPGYAGQVITVGGGGVPGGHVARGALAVGDVAAFAGGEIAVAKACAGGCARHEHRLAALIGDEHLFVQVDLDALFFGGHVRRERRKLFGGERPQVAGVYIIGVAPFVIRHVIPDLIAAVYADAGDPMGGGVIKTVGDGGGAAVMPHGVGVGHADLTQKAFLGNFAQRRHGADFDGLHAAGMHPAFIIDLVPDAVVGRFLVADGDSGDGHNTVEVKHFDEGAGEGWAGIQRGLIVEDAPLPLLGGVQEGSPGGGGLQQGQRKETGQGLSGQADEFPTGIALQV